MPVLSPRRSSSSALNNSYRNTVTTSTLDRPYYSSSYNPRYTSYSERFTTKSYTDLDGRRVFSRQGSITEDGVTTRFKEEVREGSVLRDSLESCLPSRYDRDGSVTRSTRPSLSTVNVAESVAELQKKYSPANYVPACRRSKSINDIKKPLPPPSSAAIAFDHQLVEEDVDVVVAPTKKVISNNGVNRCDDNAATTATAAASNAVVLSLTCNNTNKDDVVTTTVDDNEVTSKDDNGNRASVADICKKFDDLGDGGTSKVIAVSKKQPKVNGVVAKSTKKVATKKSLANGIVEQQDVVSADGKEDELIINGRTSNFSSYIPSEELTNGGGGLVEGSTTLEVATKDNASSVDRQHRAGAGGRDHVEYGRPTPSLLTPLSTTGTRNKGPYGLKNIGNTCFMNSVIQCLSNTRPLLEYLKNDAYLNDINTTISGMKGALIKAFALVIKELWSDELTDKVVNTVALKSQIQRFAPRFMGYAQQDAQEFLRYLLEGLHEDVNRVTTKPKPILNEIDDKLSDGEKSSESWRRYLRMDNSKIVDIFVGQLKSTLRCTHCGHCSVTFDPFWDLSLPIPQRAGALKLQQCLDYFTREETLDGDEKPTCSKCKERRKCTKSFTIQKFPKILVIHLKRFSPMERFRGKLSLTIDFPIEGLDMSNYAAEGANGDCRYNLYAISNHSGTTYSGHYTAYCCHPYTHAWHEYNDSRVSSISSKSLVSGEAYVLFYELETQKSHL